MIDGVANILTLLIPAILVSVKAGKKVVPNGNIRFCMAMIISTLVLYALAKYGSIVWVFTRRASTVQDTIEMAYIGLFFSGCGLVFFVIRDLIKGKKQKETDTNNENQ